MPWTLVWYRTDLRIRDHEPLHTAANSGSEVMPVYCLDPRQFGTTSYGFAKTGSFRVQFLLESLMDLRGSLQSLGSDLIILRGHPEVEIPKLAQTLAVTRVYCHRQVGTEEQAIESSLQQALKPLNIPLQSFWGHTLYHPDDLPFDLHRIPEVFTDFRKQIERHSSVRPRLPAPSSLAPLPSLDRGEIPTLKELGLSPPDLDPRALLKFTGGSEAAHARIQHYFWQQDRLQVYKETRNGMLNPDDASRLSPWLALGCLSPREVAEQVQEYEQRRIRNDSTYWLIFELLWRDYFQFILAKHGKRLFRAEGLQGIPIPWQEDWPRFELWCQGQTGFPLVDANMQELAATGYMSNRGRQNVGSFLTKNLGIQWLMGAEWFESLLIDYDVASNYGNWNYTAGVGNDARGFRYFNIPKQSKDYDPHGSYLKHWLPELKGIPAAKIHEPYRLNPVEQKQFEVRLGVNYPRPMVDLEKSVQTQQKRYELALKS